MDQISPSPSPVFRTQHDLDKIFRSLSVYPFDTDQDFQSGLASILGDPEGPKTKDVEEKREELVIQAQCFYYSRKFNIPPVNPSTYKAWLRSQESPAPGPAEQSSTNPTSAPNSTEPLVPETFNPIPTTTTINSSSSAPPEPPYPTSFAHIVDLITRNQPIPGIEQIPDTVLDVGSSAPNKTPRRRKPWETDSEAADLDSATGTPKVSSIPPVLRPMPSVLTAPVDGGDGDDSQAEAGAKAAAAAVATESINDESTRSDITAEK